MTVRARCPYELIVAGRDDATHQGQSKWPIISRPVLQRQCCRAVSMIHSIYLRAASLGVGYLPTTSREKPYRCGRGCGESWGGGVILATS
jgi:hypothetical protein